MNHWIIHNLRAGSLKPRVPFPVWLILQRATARGSERGRRGEKEREIEEKRNEKKSPLSMRHTKVHPPRSKSLEVVGRVLCRMPLSHVFVLRQFEDTRESNYGHPSFAPASILRVGWISRQDNSRGQFYFPESRGVVRTFLRGLADSWSLLVASESITQETR